MSNQTDTDVTTEFPSVCFEPAEDHLHYNATISNTEANGHLTGLSSCPLVEYDTSTFKSTVVIDWDLICERASYRPFFQLMYVIGSIIGSIVGGYYSDRFGRKKAIQFSLLLTVPSCVGILLVPWFSVLLVLKVISSTGIVFSYYAAFTLVAETMPPAHRGLLLNLLDISTFMALSGFGALGFVVRIWRVLWVVCNAPLIIVLLLTFVIDESPRWLAQNGRGEEAAEILEKVARQSGVEFSPEASAFLDEMRLVADKMKAEETHGTAPAWLMDAWQYFSSPAMRKILVVTPVLWIFQRLLYMGIILSANVFTKNNPFLYVVLTGTVASAAVLFVAPVIAKLSRRPFVGLTLAGSAICFLFDLAVPTDYGWISWIFVMVAFCLTVGAFQINYVYAAELLPTVIRTRGFTLFNLVGSIGEAAVPFITDIVAPQAWWASNVSFAAAGVVASLLVTLLPETKDYPLPETVADVEERERDQRRTIRKGEEKEEEEERESEDDEGEERVGGRDRTRR